MNPFFPIHIATQIVISNVLVALFFMALFAIGAKATAPRGSGSGAGIGSLQVKLAAMLGAWYLVVVLLARSGVLSPRETFFGPLPNLVLAIAIPTLIGSLLLYSASFRKLVDGIPIAWLAAFHGLRIPFGFVFLSIYELGVIPSIFAFRGGYGDIAAGALGLLTAVLYLTGASRGLARTAAVVWILEGMGDFALVLYTGIKFVPHDAPFQEFYPFMFVPAFVVPLFILTHIYAIRALIVGRRQ